MSLTTSTSSAAAAAPAPAAVTAPVAAPVAAPAAAPVRSPAAGRVDSSKNSPPALQFSSDGGIGAVTQREEKTLDQSSVSINFSPVFRKVVSVFTPAGSPVKDAQASKMSVVDLEGPTLRDSSASQAQEKADKTSGAFAAVSDGYTFEPVTSEALSQMNLLRIMMERIGVEELAAADRIRQLEVASSKRIRIQEAEAVLRIKQHEVDMGRKNDEYHLELVAGCLMETDYGVSEP